MMMKYINLSNEVFEGLDEHSIHLYYVIASLKPITKDKFHTSMELLQSYMKDKYFKSINKVVYHLLQLRKKGLVDYETPKGRRSFYLTINNIEENVFKCYGEHIETLDELNSLDVAIYLFITKYQQENNTSDCGNEKEIKSLFNIDNNTLHSVFKTLEDNDLI